MTYREKYNELISYRKENPITKEDCYCESHHVLPKSCGGTNDPENLVVLTGAEHFKAHYYLAKAMKEEKDPNYKKMMFALMRMKQQIVKNSDLTDSQLEEMSKLFGELKEEISKVISASSRGRRHSEETRRKMSEAARNRSEETRRKLSEAFKGRCFSEETKQKMSEAKKGKTRSEETRKKISIAFRGKHWFNNGRISCIANECPEGFVLGRLKKT